MDKVKLLWLFVCVVLVGPLSAQTFEFDLTIVDGLGNSQVLTIGMDPAALDTVDALDLLSPPLPPSGSFGAQLEFPSIGDTYFKDMRTSTTATTTYYLRYQPQTGGNLVMSWDNGLLVNPGTMVLTDDITGSVVNVDMLNQSSFDLTGNAFMVDKCRIVVNATTDDPKPVELSAFFAAGGNNKITLRWTTQSEIGNLGFEIYRSNDREGVYNQIASYTSYSDLEGAGNSNQPIHYRFADHQVVNDLTYWYKLAAVDFNGGVEFFGPISGIAVQNDVEIITTGNVPDVFALRDNYPNPFNPSTKIAFDLPQVSGGHGLVQLVIFDVLGRKVRTLVNSSLAPGSYILEWDGRNDFGQAVPSGVYLYGIRSLNFTSFKKMMLIK